MGHVKWWTALAVASALLPTGVVEAQDMEERRFLLGVSFVAGNPLGDLGNFFDQGFGAQIQASVPMTDDRRLRLRADLGAVVYGHERIGMCHPVGCRIGVDLTTTNNIFFFGVGPEYAFTAGGFEPYVFGTVGLSHFATISSLSGPDEYHDYFDTTNHSDLVMAWKVGGGTRLSVSRSVALDFGVERHENGIANFLTEGDILDNPDGSITLFPNRSEANLVTFRFGVSIALGG